MAHIADNQMGLRNKYVTVVVKGQLDVWTGRNPDKFPEDRATALKRADLIGGYAVTVTEILPDDVVS